MVGYMVFEFPAGLKGYGVQHNVIMHILRVQMGGNDNLIFGTPHLPCRFQADGVGFFRRDLAGFEA